MRAQAWWVLSGTASLVGWVIASASPVEAFGLAREATEWEPGQPITFVLNMANVPSTITPDHLEGAVRQAFEPWATITTAGIAFQLGRTINDSAKTGPTADGVNMIFWELGSKPRGDMVAGKAYPFSSDCDILLQPQSPFTLIDVKAVLMHELGHCLGLAHSTAPSVMTKFTGLPNLGYDDTVGVSLRYPHPDVSLEESTATLKGRVLCDGNPLLGAVLRVVDANTQRIVVAGFSGLVSAQRRTDPSGRFELPGLPPGRYVLRVEPMDAFTAADPTGYGSPVREPPQPFQPLIVEVPELEAGDTYDVGTIDVEDE